MLHQALQLLITPLFPAFFPNLPHESMTAAQNHQVQWTQRGEYISGQSIVSSEEMHTKETRKVTSIHAKKIKVNARVLTAEEGHELQQLWEDATEKEQLHKEAQAQKATEDQAQHRHRADFSQVFTGRTVND